ncbi:F-box only protein 7-like isoform X1 [Neodiprion virginianus]|uniref:F-box only protein 7-like isoform X1 n=1 Tax=Neodiprion virginianus TaxID=2961670 RepID=UPI001EE6EE52|nr:F-box only protein 7-like isoform X1 [Neodiprion virginianus]
MAEPVLVEESTPIRLAVKLEELAKTLGEDAQHHDYMVVLLIVVMAEAGFFIAGSGSADADAGYGKKRSLVIPSDWKMPDTGNYSLKFQLQPLPDRECKLLAIPCGDTLVVNLVLPYPSRKVFSRALQTVKYVNIYSSDLAGRYLNLKEFSVVFKNNMATPARCEMLSVAGIPNASLPGLPAEIKLRIIRMMDAYSLTRLAQTSREFHELVMQPIIWKRLLLRDFPQNSCPERNYYETYRMLISPLFIDRNPHQDFHETTIASTPSFMDEWWPDLEVSADFPRGRSIPLCWPVHRY